MPKKINFSPSVYFTLRMVIQNLLSTSHNGILHEDQVTSWLVSVTQHNFEFIYLHNLCELSLRCRIYKIMIFKAISKE